MIRGYGPPPTVRGHVERQKSGRKVAAAAKKSRESPLRGRSRGRRRLSDLREQRLERCGVGSREGRGAVVVGLAVVAVDEAGGRHPRRFQHALHSEREWLCE